MYTNSKKIIVTLSVLTFLMFSGQVFAASEGWKEVAENINKDQDQSLVDVAEMEKYLKMDKPRTPKRGIPLTASKTSTMHSVRKKRSMRRILRMSRAKYRLSRIM